MVHRIRWSIVVSVLAGVFVASAHAWSSLKYFEGTLCSGCFGYTPGEASREWNKVWRPGGSYFGLSSSGFTEVHETWQNPFVDNRNATYAWAYCDNDSVNVAYPVTCLTTTP
jgi:hypothetical protein